MNRQQSGEATVRESQRLLPGNTPGRLLRQTFRNRLREGLAFISPAPTRARRNSAREHARAAVEAGVIIDATRLVRRTLEGLLPTGIDRASLAYIDNYKDQARALVMWLWWPLILSPGSSRRLWKILLSPGGHSARWIRLVVAWGALAGACSLRRPTGHILFNTGHSGLEHDSYRAAMSRFRPVFLIHDLIPMTHPEYCRPGERDRHAVRIRTALQHGAALIANSQATLRELTEHAGRIRAPIPATVTAPLAPGLRRAAPGSRPIADPYFLILGTIEPRKNHWMLLQMWRQLVERSSAQIPKLMIIGRRGWECENVVDLLDRCEPLRDFVIEHPACSDDSLSNYLHHSCALLFPSFAEGYGMPLVEALALRVPVIVSDLPVFREVGRDIPEYIDPLDGRQWAETVMEYARPESHLRAAQLERLSRYREPTWSEHFAIVDDLIGRLNVST